MAVMTKTYGPALAISQEIHYDKYRQDGESFDEAMYRIAKTLSDNDEHRQVLSDILLEQRFLPAGRIQSAVGASRRTTPYNCYVSGTIADDSTDIMAKASEAFQTMRLGGGIGYDFSTLRPRGDLIKSLDSYSSGPLSFMEIFNAVCGTVSSAGHRRGAQMGVLRIDHPDIEDFIDAKQNSDRLTNFNISVAVTDAFMAALDDGKPFDLSFGGRVYRSIDPRALWDKLMRATWDWAEPGVIFIDRMNWKNNLHYAETIAATNPCAEQPLPPYGACLLGSFNLVKYVVKVGDGWLFNSSLFKEDIHHVVRAMDNVVDVALYPLPQQELEAKSKRRMGLGVTGVANAIERIGFSYGSTGFINELKFVLALLRNEAYSASINLALEKGPFPLFDPIKYTKSNFIKRLPEYLQNDIRTYGIRNSHLLSIAPTGTISLSADNVSSGIEPVFSHSYTRRIREFNGERTELVEDYAVGTWQLRGRTADQVTPDEHVAVLNAASYYVDSAVSKTCNIGDHVTFDDFKSVYRKAYDGGASGCTTFRAAGKRYGILNAAPQADSIEQGEEQGSACYIDPETGKKECS
jgi:ribonucleoside-diphosphate reductase alpha chain